MSFAPMKSTLMACVLAAASLSTSAAQEAATDPVFVFNKTCYAQVPNVHAIQNMARELAWRESGGEDLKKFTTVADPEVLMGWDAQVGEQIYRVGVVQSTPPKSLAEAFPGFANGKATSCTIVVDDKQDGAQMVANMGKLAGKDPVSKDVAEGPLLTTTWAGGNDDLKVFLFAKTPENRKGGLMAVTVLQK